MWRILRKRVTAGAMAAMLMLVNVVVPVQPVFADVGGASDSGTETTLEPDTNTEGVANALVSATIVEAKTVELDYKHKATLCHATNAATNPYVVITVDYHSFTKNGHDIHDGPIADSVAEAQRLKSQKKDWGDIIPAVPEWGYGGKNVPAGQSILANNCNVPEGEPEIVSIPATLKSEDPCGLDNIYLVTDDLDSIENISYVVNSDGSVKVTADEGYVLTFNGTTTLATYLYELKTEDSKVLCEALSEKPKFVDPCGTTNDYYQVEKTEYVEYYNGEELLKAGKKYYVTDASEVTITAKVTDDDYEIVNQTEYVKQFTDKACVELDVKAWCDNVVDTKIKATVTNTTKMRQAYQVVVTDSEDNELYTKVVLLKKGATEKVYVSVDGDGEFTVSVYNFTKKDGRGTLLEQATVMTECVDTFTPEIYKKNQDGAILSTGTFDVEVCQEYGEFALRFMDDEGDNCTTYEDVMFGTDGSWFANNVEYEHNVPTTVTITETEAPVGCELSITPWVFTWNYLNMDVNAFNAFLAQREGSWEMTSGVGSVDGQVFNLTNNCDQPGRGEYTPTPSTPSTPVETLAETGDSENAIIGVAAGMLLASIGLAISPRFRRGEA